MSELATRIRAILDEDPNVREVRMFGGLCFMLNGNMLVCTTKDERLLARIGQAGLADALAVSGVVRMTMAGREMKDFVVVAQDAIADDGALARWIAVATRYVGPMPAKDKPARRKTG
ncbi:TfoX/Sxy family protein [Mesorhizobium sp. CAU 1732]|uniref:TfoX/Sxy family protein n=1 Tax=Mesorhizobium sp. CAU 1732 TaxID=3140358 RepID=UPI0032618759